MPVSDKPADNRRKRRTSPTGPHESLNEGVGSGVYAPRDEDAADMPQKDTKIHFESTSVSVGGMPDAQAANRDCADGGDARKKGLGRGEHRKGGKKDAAPGSSTRDFQNPGLKLTDLKELQQSLTSLKIPTLAAVSASNDISTYRNVRWETLNVSRKVIDMLHKVGFSYPSPVQVLSIPHAIRGTDLLVRAKNGTGKSASFIIPILNGIDTSRLVQAIILVPIRELALQISKVFMTLGRDLGIKSVPLVGGTNMTDDIMRLGAGVHVIIGTPGRILDMLSKKLCRVENNPIVVFDEADKLLDSLFYGSVYQLLQLLPGKKQMLLYSATFPQSIEGFVQQNMNSPLKIKVSEQNLQNIKQYLTKIKNHTKLPCLKSLLSILDFDQCIIYCNSIANVKNLAQKITSLGMSAYFIYSDMDQDERNIVYHNFSKKKCRILVSTDITTRGIDVPGVNLVINFDMPASSESYLHRIGRAGRFGTNGCAINFINEQHVSLIHMYENALGVNVLPISDPSFKDFCKQ